MIESFIQFISEHATYAHLMAFGALLLAGLNLPVSIDIVLAICALLAAHVLPEKKYHLLVACFLGCYFSAWISYALGRFLGQKLSKYNWFQKLFPQKKLDKLSAFYNKHGLLTLIIGRFIPFGVRNGIFMTTGMSRLSFATFAKRDVLACGIWSLAAFSLFYSVGLNYETLFEHIKHWNIIIFSVFFVGLSIFFWVRKKKKSSS